MHCFYWDPRQQNRFYCVNKEDETKMENFNETHCMYWVSDILSSIVFKNYLEQKGFMAVILTDEKIPESPYVVVSNELWEI